MALFTSTPKSKLLIEEKVTLLTLDSEDEDFSSGYDSPVHISDKDSNRNCQRRLQIEQSSDDSDFSSDESTPLEYSSSEDDDIGDDDDTDSVESMKVTSTQTLVENIRYILSMPELCDVLFIVGPQRVPLYGLKAILSTRSRSFFVMFLKHAKEAMKQTKKKTKKTKQAQPDKNNRLTIIIDNYNADIFHTFLLFVHCGSIVMEPSSVTGLLCLATEFDIPDLRNACWDFIERCLSVQANTSLLMQDTFYYGDHKAAQKLRLKILRMPSTKTISTSSTLLKDSNDSRNSGQDSRNSGQDSRNSVQDSRNSGQDSRNSVQDSRNSGQDSRNSGQDSRNSVQDSRSSGQDSRNSGQGSCISIETLV
ncbi:uncharacterized protein LOC143068699 [Mytilus galloprovincialis]|uniref:uncharacterized protein LOC143068699 n=1 Tax=Mytilus galloprovincialis TaxID=29158 RepID=UPI003F7C70E8